MKPQKRKKEGPLQKNPVRRRNHPLKRGPNPLPPLLMSFHQVQKKIVTKRKTVVVILYLQRVNTNQKRQSRGVVEVVLKKGGGVIMICHQTKTVPHHQERNGAKKRKGKGRRRKKKLSDSEEASFSSDSDSEPKSKRSKKQQATGYTKPMKLSEDLEAIVGTDTAPRHEVVKQMWAYIKENDLQDPKNKQFAICDEKLEKVIGEKRFKCFGMAKYLKEHMS